MKLFDPEFSELSTNQLAAIDSLCGEYESKRTTGGAVSVEEFLLKATPEIQSPLRLELIQVELEILDAWDQLDSPDAMLQRFPDLGEFIQRQWGILKTRTRPQQSFKVKIDTRIAAASAGSTHDDGRSEQPLPPLHIESPPTLEDPSPRFHIIRNLAQGGIGTVFVAFDRDLQREVAIKELKRKFATDRAVVQRFEAEATVTGNLEHPNIVPIYATGVRSDGRPYYAMRLIRGRSMQAAISELHSQHGPDLDFRRDLSARDLMLRFITVCRAIGFAHSHGVLHRDLKPSNIMVGDFGETLVVDWGLARKLHPTNPLELQSNQNPNAEQRDMKNTLSGTIVGTPGYMSPEQATGRNQDVTIASDIYSLGATLFHILTNNIPFMHTGSHAKKHANFEVSVLNPAEQIQTDVCIAHALQFGTELSLNKFGSFPSALDAICRKAMKFDANARYATAEMLASDLEAWLADEPVTVLAESRLQRMRRWARAHPTSAGAGLGSVLITLLAMGITLSILSVKNESLRIANRREQEATQKAEASAAIAKTNAVEAVRQRQRVLGILNTFLVDVQRGLANVPGSASVQRNVLTTVLNKLGEVSSDFGDDDNANISNAMALVDLGDLFARVGTKDVKLDLTLWNQQTSSPLEAARLMYAEAMKVAERSRSKEGVDPRRMVAVIQLKQAEILRQTAHSTEALELIDASLSTRRLLLVEFPDSIEAAMDVVTAIDQYGQLYLQSGDFSKARAAFEETQEILMQLTKKAPREIEIKRMLGLSLSRMADIAVHNGDLDKAALLYDQDLAIATELYLGQPNDGTAKRDLCVSLDRVGNMLVKRGQIEKSMSVYLESRRLREELHAAEPSDIKSIRELFVSYMKGGDTRMLLKDVATAQSDYKIALALADDLARIDPQNATARRFQSMSAEVLADVAISQNQLDDALLYAERSLDISIELAAKDPTDGQMQRDLYICYAKVAKVHLARKDFDACLRNLFFALNAVKIAKDQQPESLQAIMDHNSVLLRIAEAHLEAGDAASAVKECETVILIHESIPESNRQDGTLRRRLANTYTMLGRALLADSQPVQALQTLEHSRQLTNTMIDEGVRVEQMQLDLTEIENLISTFPAKF